MFLFLPVRFFLMFAMGMLLAPVLLLTALEHHEWYEDQGKQRQNGSQDDEWC
jgi:hypothetical protein